jgi:hypothetical protein
MTKKGKQKTAERKRLIQGAQKINQDDKEDKRLLVIEIIKSLPRGQGFKTSEEADAYLREERDSWDR